MNNFFLAKSVKEGNSCADNFLNNKDNSDDDNIKVDVVKVSDNGEQSPN
jgi:hypothetical protein